MRVIVGPGLNWNRLQERREGHAQPGFEAGLDVMKPETTMGELIDFTTSFGDKHGHGMKTAILMHGRDLGDDGPLLTPRASGEEIRGFETQALPAWISKPTVHSADGNISFTWGVDVVVAEKGDEVLFKRDHGMISTASVAGKSIRHATTPSLEVLQGLLDAIRERTALREKKSGIFYRKSAAVLHFHEDPAGLLADVEVGREFERLPVNSPRQRRELLKRLARLLQSP